MNNLLLGIFTSIVFIIIKILYTKFVEQEEMNIKMLFKELFIIFSSIYAGMFLLAQTEPLFTSAGHVAQVFTDKPAF